MNNYLPLVLRNLYQLWQIEIKLLFFPNVEKLAGRVEQTGGYNFSVMGKNKNKKKFQLVKPGSQLFIITKL